MMPVIELAPPLVMLKERVAEKILCPGVTVLAHDTMVLSEVDEATARAIMKRRATEFLEESA